MGKNFKASDVERNTRLLQRQMDKTFGKDSGGDSQVEVLLIDRTRYEPFRFEPVLYRHKDMQGEVVEGRGGNTEVLEERLRMLHLNADAANGDLSLELRIDLAQRTRVRFAQSAAGRKLIASHARMEHNVGLGVRGCPVCDGVVEVK
jgi:hypothetical protein